MSLSDLPLEVIARIAGGLDRQSLNNFEATCKTVKRVVDNPVMVTKPWSNRSPFPTLPGGFRWLFFSQDGTRVAALTTYAGNVRRTLQVWDRAKGLLGELEDPVMAILPAFSPDNLLLVLGPASGGITVWQLPSGREPQVQETPMIMSHHRLNGAWVTSAAFVDNSTIAIMDKNQNGVKTSEINREHGHVTIADPATIITDPDHHLFSDGLGVWKGCLASFSGKKKDIVVFVYDKADRTVVFHDRRRNASVSRPILTSALQVQGLLISPNGNLLVVAHDSGLLSLFDCSAHRIEDIGQPRAIRVNETESYLWRSISFSLNGSKIVVSHGGSHEGLRHFVIDANHGELLSDGCNDSWEMLVS